MQPLNFSLVNIVCLQVAILNRGRFALSSKRFFDGNKILRMITLRYITVTNIQCLAYCSKDTRALNSTIWLHIDTL